MDINTKVYPYKIIWYEDVDKKGKELKDYMETLPNATIKGQLYWGAYDIECWDIIYAQTIEDVKNIIKKDYYEVEVFSIVDKQGKTILTEEDID